jgi:hypothetical protein
LSVAALSPSTSFRFGTCPAPCGREDWLQLSTNLCFNCRKETAMSNKMIKVEATYLGPLAAPAELAPYSTRLAEYLAPESRAMELANDEDLQLATNIINDIKHGLDDLEAIRQTVSLPISQGLDRYNALFRPAKKQAQEARELWNDKIRTFLDRREAAQRAAEAALQQAITTQNAPAATAAIVALKPAPKAAGLGLQEAWAFEEFNHDIVPTSLTITDPKLVKAEIDRQLAAGETQPAISGMRIFKRPVIKATG